MKYLFFLMILFSFYTNNFQCQDPKSDNNPKIKETNFLKPIEKVIEEYTPYLMTIPGVIGTAIGECDEKPCIKVLVNTFNEEIEVKIASTIEGYPVVIEEIGEIKAF